VWSVDGNRAFTAFRGSVEGEGIPYDRLILATGAIDKIAPVPGWTLPGVYSLGGAQVLLKDQGCAIGRMVVFYGSSPLLYLGAWQYIEAGAGQVTILDTTPFSAKVAATRRIAAAPAVLRQGLGLIARLRMRGLRIRHGVTDLRILGNECVARITYHWRGRKETEPCDAVAIGHGLRSETQLAELAGCRLSYNQTFDQWQPSIDSDGRGAEGIYLAGDGTRIGGAVAAEMSGRLAAYACLTDLGRMVDAAKVTAIRHRRDAHWEAQIGLAQAFAWPRHSFAALPEETVLCRCEDVTAGQVRQIAKAMTGISDINRVKALSRCGMGRCQSRMCGLAAIEVAAAVRSEMPQSLTHYRTQPPVKPVSIPAPRTQEA
jgi:NADPH-dependent 2,4-dienoyl-CoA reductase/sulfur reductase-like enzyme